MPFSPRALRAVRRLAAPSILAPEGFLAQNAGSAPSLSLFFILSEGERAGVTRAKLTHLFRDGIAKNSEVTSVSSHWTISSNRRGGGRLGFFNHPAISSLTGLSSNCGASWFLIVADSDVQCCVSSFLTMVKALASVLESAEAQSLTGNRSVRLVLIFSGSTLLWAERPALSSSAGANPASASLGQLQTIAEKSVKSIAASFTNLSIQSATPISSRLEFSAYNLTRRADILVGNLKKALYYLYPFLMSLTLYGITLPADRPVTQALQFLPGLGKRRAQELCRILGFAPALRVQDLTAEQEVALANHLRQNYIVAGPLAEARARSIDRLRRNGSVRGYRIRTGLPVRGQRTHSNGQTARRLRGQARAGKLLSVRLLYLEGWQSGQMRPTVTRWRSPPR